MGADYNPARVHFVGRPQSDRRPGPESLLGESVTSVALVRYHWHPISQQRATCFSPTGMWRSRITRLFVGERFTEHLLYPDAKAPTDFRRFRAAPSRHAKNFFIPSVNTEGTLAQPVSTSLSTTNTAGHALTNSAAPEKSNPNNPPTTREPAVFQGRNPAGNSATANPVTTGVAGETKTNPSDVALGAAIQISTNAPAASDEDARMSYFDRQIASFLRHIIFGTYLLVLLLFLIFLAYRMWLWAQ